jgi:glycosyltransferase involved in cell wall biosynthesis
MRILLISRDFSISGGVGKHLHATTRALAGRNLDVAVMHAAREAPDGLPAGIPVWTVPGVQRTDCAHNAEAIAVIKQFRPDVVHVHGGSNFALEAELRRRLPTLKTLHTLDFCPTGSRYHFLTRRACVHEAGWPCLIRTPLKRCTLSKRPTVWWRQVRRARAARANNLAHRLLVVTSSYMRAQALLHGCDPARVHVLPYFASLPADPSPLPAKARILFAGRVYVEKGLDLLVRAYARLPHDDVVLDVVGDGPGIRRVRRLAARFRVADRVVFHGWQIDLDPYFRRATVLVVPSRLSEPFGIVGIEAGAHARPVVAFDVGGISDWLAEGVSGSLVRPHDVSALATSLADLLGHPEQARRMGERGRARVESEFSPERHLARLLDLYRTAAHG